MRYFYLARAAGHFTARFSYGEGIRKSALSEPTVPKGFLHGGVPAATPPTHPSFKSGRPCGTKIKHPTRRCFILARAAGLEPVTFPVTGGRSNQAELRPQIDCYSMPYSPFVGKYLFKRVYGFLIYFAALLITLKHIEARGGRRKNNHGRLLLRSEFLGAVKSYF